MQERTMLWKKSQSKPEHGMSEARLNLTFNLGYDYSFRENERTCPAS